MAQQKKDGPKDDRQPARKPKQRKKYRKPELGEHGVLSIVEGD